MEKIIVLILITVFINVIAIGASTTGKRRNEQSTGESSKKQKQDDDTLINVSILLDLNKDREVDYSDLTRLKDSRLWKENVVTENDQKHLIEEITPDRSPSTDYLDEFIPDKIDLNKANNGLSMTREEIKEIFNLSDEQVSILVGLRQRLTPAELKTAFTDKKLV